MDMRPEAIAAVLDLPDAASAEKRQRWLEARRAEAGHDPGGQRL